MATLAPPAHSHPHPHSHPNKRASHPPTPPHSSPSSPSSIHSSSSAIFERDIEPLSLSLAPAPRDHALAGVVPSVLDEAVEALTRSEAQDDVEVEMVGNMSHDAEQQSSGGSMSRSPSPPGIPAASSIGATRPPMPERQSTVQYVPGGLPAPASPTSLPPSPPPHGEVIPGLTPTTTSPAPALSRSVGSHSTPSKRLSFVSYSDLLLSSPVTSLPLSQVTHNPHQPPHLPQLAPAQSSAFLTPLARSREASTYGDEGGEWEREGLGRGLEERLEEVLRNDPNPNPNHP